MILISLKFHYVTWYSLFRYECEGLPIHFHINYICQDSICKMKREHTRPPSQKIKQGKYFSIQWRKMKNWNYCTQSPMCIHAIVFNRLIQIIYKLMRFFITSTASFFKIYFILFIQGRTRFKMNIVILLWYEFIDILKSCCKNGRAMNVLFGQYREYYLYRAL